MKRLTAEQKNFFEANGYLPYGPLLSAERIRQLGEAIDGIASGAIDFPPELIRWEPVADQLAGTTERKYLVFQIRYPHRHVPLFFEHAHDPVILDVLEDLLGPDIVLYNTQVLLKPPFHGTDVPWHQDSAYWPIRPANLVTCWIALDEANAENGCMQFLPGSHKMGLLEHKEGRVLAHASGGTPSTVMKLELNDAEAVPVPAQPGFGSFHHSLTAHRTSANNSPHRRRALITSYTPLEFSYTGPADDRPKFPVVRGKRAGEVA